MISPGHVIECNTLPHFWEPSTDEFGQLASDWKSQKMGGCNGGFPVLMMEMLQKRGAGIANVVGQLGRSGLAYVEESSGKVLNNDGAT